MAVENRKIGDQSIVEDENGGLDTNEKEIMGGAGATKRGEVKEDGLRRGARVLSHCRGQMIMKRRELIYY